MKDRTDFWMRATRSRSSSVQGSASGVVYTVLDATVPPSVTMRCTIAGLFSFPSS